ncbi:MAG: PD-(D/E)XK nuclease family protein, partial [Pseudomonadota bacterium]
LLVPERRVGLQAHDFQQAAGAPRIVLSRAKRDGDADTVPARWLNRITNLLSGLNGGDDALLEMRARGETRLSQARALDRMEITSPKATRPKPKPPLEARPRRLSVTQIQTLVRDPYAIYATKVLGLRALNDLDAEPGARLRGILVHRVFEDFVSQGELTPERLIKLAENAFADMEEREVAALWVAAIRNWADDFVAAEVGRQSRATPVAFEKRGKMEFPDLGFTLSGEADRIDRADDGRLVIYDYKTGTMPTHKVMNRYDRQLLLEAVMAEDGAFDDVPPATVSRVVHLKIGNDLDERDTPLEDLKDGDFRTAKVRAAFEALIAAYLDPDQGFLSRRMLQFEGDPREFDHLARLGEWSEADEAGS